MTAWIKIGLRNLVKNRRRTLVTALAISLGLAAVNLFGGFAKYMHTGDEIAAIYARSLGHLVVFKKGFLDSGRPEPSRHLLTAEELETIKAIRADYPCVDVVCHREQPGKTSLTPWGASSARGVSRVRAHALTGILGFAIVGFWFIR